MLWQIQNCCSGRHISFIATHAAVAQSGTAQAWNYRKYHLACFRKDVPVQMPTPDWRANFGLASEVLHSLRSIAQNQSGWLESLGCGVYTHSNTSKHFYCAKL